MFSQISPSLLQSTVREYASDGGAEPYTFEVIRDTLYIFSSELATLRMFRKFNGFVRNKNTDQGYSENLKTFYFSITAKVN